jgi:hypothetical protein
VVTNHHDSALYRHPTIARGVAETVNWTMKGAENSTKIKCNIYTGFMLYRLPVSIFSNE